MSATSLQKGDKKQKKLPVGCGQGGKKSSVPSKRGHSVKNTTAAASENIVSKKRLVKTGKAKLPSDVSVECVMLEGMRRLYMMTRSCR